MRRAFNNNPLACKTALLGPNECGGSSMELKALATSDKCRGHDTQEALSNRLCESHGCSRSPNAADQLLCASQCR